MPSDGALARQLEAGVDPAGETKDQLMRAAEHLFAREGIDGTPIRQINQLAGQRNPCSRGTSVYLRPCAASNSRSAGS